MARRALLVGINDYQNLDDLRGCLNDVDNMRDVLKSSLGFGNNDIRVLLDNRATKDAIMYRLNWMVDNAAPGDLMFFHFSGHGSQIRDRGVQDELKDHMDEILCTWGMTNGWDNGDYIVDDDLQEVFDKIPAGASLEVFLDCCHSGWETGESMAGGYRGVSMYSGGSGEDIRYRYLPPPRDIEYRHEGEEENMRGTKRFAGEDSNASRYVIWAACQPHQKAADAFIDGNFYGAFTYTFSRCMREVNGNISRGDLIERIRNMMRTQNYYQIPELKTGSPDTLSQRPLQFSEMGKQERLLFLTSPNMRGNDVLQMQQALANKGYDIKLDGHFGPGTRIMVIRFQERNGLKADGVVGPAVRKLLFG